MSLGSIKLKDAHYKIPSRRLVKDGGSEKTLTITVDMLREHVFRVVAARR